jgi:hypothetical protein
MPVDKELLNLYINQLNEAEKKALEIAEEILESSFDIKKSIGFQDWLKRHEQNP